MTFKTISAQALLLLTFVFTASTIQAKNLGIIMEGRLDSINKERGYIVANDIKFPIDHFTRVYDTNGRLQSLKHLRKGRRLKMYYRKFDNEATPISKMILDKIIYY